MNAAPNADWTEANQRYLAAEFARLKAQLSGAGAQAANERVREIRAALPEPAAIDQLAETFGLSAFERDLLLLCAGVEMDAGVAACCAADASGRPYATFGLALATLAEPHWSAITPVRPLRLWRLIEVKDDQGLAGSRLTIDERVVHYLAGVSYLDTRLRPLLRVHASPAAMAEGHARVVEAAVQALERDDAMSVLQLVGDDGAGQRDVAGAIAHRFGLQLHLLRAADIPTSLHELDALALLWRREAALLGSALLIECEDGAHGAARLAQRPGGLVFIGAREPVPIHRPALQFAVDKPGAADQRRLWARALGVEAARLNGALDGVATQFRLSAETIARTGEALRPALAASPTPDAALWQACRASVRNEARRPRATRRTRGALGRSGAARAAEGNIAPDRRSREAPLRGVRRLGLRRKGRPRPRHQRAVRRRERHRQDHGRRGAGQRAAASTSTASTSPPSVSKYIGETEKNLARVFDAAEDSGAILLFDEADALFGKRSEVKDSHDRYANIEVSYLLQRMEAYRGLAILTTNLKNALDTAFLRRLRFVVQFPFPDAQRRELIWRGIFPAATPLEGVDCAKLARLNVAGGGIRNIAMNAAFLAAAAGSPVAMPHLLQAARSEAAKRERALSDAETRGWV